MAETLPGVLAESASRFGSRPFLWVKGEGDSRAPLSYTDFQTRAQEVAAGLAALGVSHGDRVGLLSDNRPEWIEADFGILGAGAADVPRGSDLATPEIATILGHSESVGTFVENGKVLERLAAARPKLPALRFAVVLDGTPPRSGDFGIPLAEVRARGREALAKGDRRAAEACARLRPDDLATLIYTSGTTGEPKGVRLRHRNLLHNVRTLPPLVGIGPEDVLLSLLPSWHVFERAVEYVICASGASMAYGHPARQMLLRDLASVRPTLLAGVPRLWDGLREGAAAAAEKKGPKAARIFAWACRVGTRSARARRTLLGREPDFGGEDRPGSFLGAALVAAGLAIPHAVARLLVFRAVHRKLGGRLRFAISGGGALPPAVDDFFAAAGIPLYEGYGLTETSPIVAIRDPRRPVARTVGSVVPQTEIRVVDESGGALPAGTKGRIQVRGPQVMEGYHRRPDLTAAVVSPDGWFDTGDLGRLSLRGEVQLVGRAKDQIALLSGEKVDPERVEARLCESPLIAQAVVVGQDKPVLGALVVPRVEAIAARLATDGQTPGAEALVRDPRASSLVEQEASRLLTSEAGFKRYERVARVALLPREFKVGEELTATLKVKRAVVAQRYGELIETLWR